jgi:hypothetical protein
MDRTTGSHEDTKRGRAATKEYVAPDWDAEAFHIEVVNVYLHTAFSPRTVPSSKKMAES